MTFSDIQLAIYRRLNYADSPAADVITRTKQWINLWHQRLLSKPGLEGLRDTTLTFASVASQTQYALPQGVTRIKKIFEQTSPRTLRSESLTWIRNYDPQLLATGVPELWAPVSWKMVAAQPSTTGVWVVSTSAADTTQTAYIEGLRTGGYRSGSISASLNGTTRVAMGTFTDYIDLDKAYVSAVGAGVISFYDASSSGNELARISIGQTGARYECIQLWPTPATAITYSVDCQRVAEDMTIATDVPLLPLEYHYLLVEAGCYEEWLRKDDARMATAKSELDKGLGDMRYWIACQPDYRPQAGEVVDRPSRLGGQYPAW